MGFVIGLYLVFLVESDRSFSSLFVVFCVSFFVLWYLEVLFVLRKRLIRQKAGKGLVSLSLEAAS